MPPIAAEISGEETRPAPLPPFARPKDGATPADEPVIKLGWMPDQDAAIVGVIDSAIALSHARFRRLDNGSRFLAAWLQGGEWRDGSAVHFGRELFRTEIDHLMFRARKAGTIDEGLFDREADVTQFPEARGDRRAENSATHGTFVADLAAGFDLRRGEDDEHRRRLPLIAVGLPPNTSMGSSGSFLEFYALHAIEYIIDRADRIWRACGYEGPGFPIIINLSYGLQAGPKDGYMLIERVINYVNEKAEETGRPIRVILPAGNDLLSEGAAKFTFGDPPQSELDWRLQPEDQTPNYAEIWSDLIEGAGPKAPEHPLGVCLTPPNGPTSSGDPGCHGQMMTLSDDHGPVARIYCRKYEGGEASNPWHRMQYVLCTRPTLPEDRRPGAQPGGWTLKVVTEIATVGYGYVQSDQSLTYGSETGLASYFAHPDFHDFDETGRYIDVYSYPTDGTDPVDTDVTPPMRRRATLNTIASLAGARVIGSYRKTDGKPSIYSSAASSDAVGAGRVAPTCLLPGEEGAAQFGLMAAGSKSGSAALMSGTSFSTALATRMVAIAMLGWIDGKRVGEAPGTEDWFQAEALTHEGIKDWPGDVRPEKAGFGRLTTPATGRMERSFVAE